MSDKEDICFIACNHLKFLSKSGFWGTYTVKLKDGIIYHAVEEKSLHFGNNGGTEKHGNNNPKD